MNQQFSFEVESFDTYRALNEETSLFNGIVSTFRPQPPARPSTLPLTANRWHFALRSNVASVASTN
jgi:hypothetical protein